MFLHSIQAKPSWTVRKWIVLAVVLGAVLFFVPSASAETTVSGTIGTSTWTEANSPYHLVGTVIVNGVLTVEPGVTVIADPGTLLQLGKSSASSITGSMNALGTQSQPIVFTSANGAVGGWGGLKFQPQGSATSVIRNATIEKATVNVDVSNPATLTLDNVTVQDSSSQAVNGGSGVVTIKSSTIQNNPSGLNFGMPAALTLQDVSILNSGATPIRGGFGQSFANVLIDGVPATEIRVVGGTADSPTMTSALPYHVTGTVTIRGVATVHAGATLRFDPGTELGVGNQGATPVVGSLNAIGTESQPILFTSANGAIGGWSGLNFKPSSNTASVIRNATIEKMTETSATTRATVTFDNVTLQDSSIHAFGGSGTAIVSLISSTIQNNPTGFDFDIATSLTLQDVTFVNSGSAPILGGFAQSFANVVIDGQPASEFRVTSGIADNPVATNVLPYHVTGTVTIRGVATVQPGATLRFDPGAQLSVGNQGATPIVGALNAIGTVGQPILFTSANGAVGGWSGLNFKPSSNTASVIRNATIEKMTEVDATTRATVTFDNVTLQDSSVHAFGASGTAIVSIISSTVRDNPTGFNFAILTTLSLQDVTFVNSGSAPILGGFAQSFANVVIDGLPASEFRIAGGIAENPTAVASPLPYHVTATVTIRGVGTIQPGVILRFDPGVQLAIGNQGATPVVGSLNALGTTDQPILFTSANGAVGGWSGLNFKPSSNTASVIRNATIEKMTELDATTRATVTFDNVTLQHSSTQAFQTTGTAIVTIKSSAIRDHPVGLRFSIDSSLTLQDVVIEASGAQPILGGFAQSFADVLVDGEPPTEIRVVSGRATSPTARTSTLPYRLLGTVTVTGTANVQPGVTIHFDPDTELKLGSVGAVDLTASLQALGTPAQPILFAPTNGMVGGWSGIEFSSRSSVTSVIRNATIEKAEIGIIKSATTSLSIDNTTVRSSSSQDVSCSGGVLTIKRSIFRDSPKGLGVANCGSFTARDSAFVGHTDFAVSAGETTAADAAISYWGAPDGPSGIGSGQGGAAQGNVLYVPFIVDVPSPPSGVVATPGSGEIQLTWAAPTDVGTIFRHEIFRATSPGGDAIAVGIAPEGSLSFADADLSLVPGITYYYKIRGVNIVGPGAFSDEVGSVVLNAAGSNVIVPKNEALYDVRPGAQLTNATSLVNPSNLDAGGLICDVAGSAPTTPSAQIACADARHTQGGEYDGDLTTWVTYYDRLAPVNPTCGLVGIESPGRPVSNVTFYLSSPRLVDHAQMSTRAMPGLGNYDKMCAAVHVQDAATGAWSQILLRNGYPDPDQILTDAATFEPQAITGVMVVAQWNQLIGSNPPGGWMGIHLLDLHVSSAGIELTHPVDGQTYESNLQEGFATTATADAIGPWSRVEFRLGSPGGELLGTASANPWEADVTLPVGSSQLCAVAVHAAGTTLSACKDIVVVSSAPSAPSALQAEAGEDAGTIELEWAAATPAAGHPIAEYRVYRGATSGGPYSPIGSTTGLTYLDADLPTGAYHYVVRAVTENNIEGPSSNEASVTITGISLTDGFELKNYLPESPSGNTPFGGIPIKSTFGDAGGEPSVNLANGELVASFPLLRIDEHLGDDFVFALTFRSIGNADGERSLGPRWDANWFQSLEPTETGYTLRTGDGRSLEFTTAPGGWEGPPGSYEMIVAEGGMLELRDREGNRRVFDPFQGFVLKEVYDAARNRWTIDYDAELNVGTITDPSGRVARLEYADGKLAAITDWAGRTATLVHDPTTGRLVAVSTPGPSVGTFSTTRFSYDVNDRIATIRDPLNNEYLRIDYDPLGRVLAQRASAGVGAYFQHYYGSGIAFARDAGGNKTEWRFLHGDAIVPRVVPSANVVHTHGLRATDPESFTTAYSYNSNDEPTSVEFPAGNSVAYTYDEASTSFFARGNLLAETRSPGPIAAPPAQSTTQASITTRFTYDAACNKPATIVDPRGTDASFVPPNGGTASAARYTTTIAYSMACKPVSIQRPTVNPAGVPHALFTSAYANQVIGESFTYNDAGQLLTYTDPSGLVESRTYYTSSSPGKPAGYLESVTVDPGTAPRLALTTSYEYTEFGTIERVTDPRGNVRTYHVDLQGRPTQEVGPPLAPGTDGIRTLWAYDGNGNLLSVQRETLAGTGEFASTEYTYDPMDRRLTQTVRVDATRAITTSYGYDSKGNVVRETGGAGEERSWAFDERGLLLFESGPDGGSYAYDLNGNLATKVDPLGIATSFTYDGYDRLGVVTDARESSFITSYDPAGNVVTEQGNGGTSDRILYVRNHEHDEGGRGYQSQEWLQSAESMPFASTGSVGTGGRWVTTLREFDERGLVTRHINDNLRVTGMSYDVVGRLHTTTDPIGNVVENAYDPHGNLVQLTRTIAGASTSTCPQVCTTTHAYDAEDRPTTTTNSDGTTRVLSYDGLGNVVRTDDEAGRVTLYSYDLAGRPTMTRQAFGLATEVATTTVWDDENRVASQCDGAQHCTSYTYVPGTSLEATVEPPLASGRPRVATTYDDAGNARTVSYSSGKSVTLGYDALHRLIRIDLAAESRLQGTTRQSFTYDDMGRVTEARDNGVANLEGSLAAALTEITARQQFDTMGHVIGESQLGLPLTHTVDGVGNVLSTAYPSVDGRTVTRVYDANDRLRRVWDSKSLLAEYDYGGGLVAEKAFGGPRPNPPATGASAPVSRTTIAYDNAQRPTSIVHGDGLGVSWASLTTRFDDVGDRVAQKLQGSGSTDAYSQLYGKDGLSRAAAWKRGPITSSSPSTPLDTIANPLEQGTWQVDGQNNWGPWSHDATSCLRTTATTGATPPLRHVTDACLTTTTPYSYDANGNLISNGTHTYHWDLLDRLVRVEDASGDLVVNYAYDAFDRRVIKVFPNNGGVAAGGQGTEEGWYTFAGPHVVQEAQPFGSVVPTTIPPSASGVHVIRQWVYGPSVDEVLVMDVDESQDGATAVGPGDKRFFYAFDSGGNVLGLTSETGHLVEGYAYAAYGDVTILTPRPPSTGVRWDGTDIVSEGTYGTDPTPRPYSPSGNLWFFTGRQYDPEAGLYNYRARHYHPQLGQFMSADPTGAWSDPVSLGNPYAYVGNNPGSWTDPSGMWSLNPFDADFFVWEAPAVATGTLGAIVPGTIGLVSGQGLDSYAAGWDAGASFSPFGTISEDARTRVRSTLADSAAPAPLLTTLDVLGLPQTRGEAGLELAFSVIPIGKLGKIAKVADDVVPTSLTKRWKVGDPIDAPTASGKQPAWSTVRERYWKNEAANDAGEWSAENLARMSRGRAPMHAELPAKMELHHIVPRSQGGANSLDNLERLWPWEHMDKDPHRFYRGPRP